MIGAEVTLSVELSGLDKLKNAADEVIKKAEELEQAVQRLNEVEIVLQSHLADK